MKRIRFTQAGYDALKKEYDALVLQRPHVVEDLKTAREMGDLSENGYYKASRAKLSFVDSSMRRIDMQLKYAMVTDSSKTDTVEVGSNVTIKTGDREMKYEIVGDLEANPSQGKISLLSPLGKALAHKRVSERLSLLKERFLILLLPLYS